MKFPAYSIACTSNQQCAKGLQHYSRIVYDIVYSANNNAMYNICKYSHKAHHIIQRPSLPFNTKYRRLLRTPDASVVAGQMKIILSIIISLKPNGAATKHTEINCRKNSPN